MLVYRSLALEVVCAMRYAPRRKKILQYGDGKALKYGRQ